MRGIWGMALAGAVATLAAAPAQADVVVTVSKSQQRMSVSVDGNETYRWMVSTGRSRYATPSGKFRPVRFEPNWFSRTYDWAPMPNSIFFYKGYAIHGTTEVRALGRMASHGCVRLDPKNAATLFRLARASKRVNIVVTDARLPAAPPAAPSQTLARQEEPADPASNSLALADAKPSTALSAKASPAKEAAQEIKPETSPSRLVSNLGLNLASNIALPEPKDILRPGTHVVAMNVSGEAELKAVYRKYGFAW